MAGYKDYNNYSQQDKDSMRTEADIKSNTNEEAIISQTDQVETLLGDIKTALATVNTKLTTIAGKIDTVNTNLGTIQGKQDTAKGVLDTIASNTTPTA